MTPGLPDTPVVAPSREDPLVGAASEVLGGPLGRRAAADPRAARTAGRVLVAAAAASTGLALLGRQHCRAQGWTTPDQFFHACYSDLPVFSAAVGDGGLAEPPGVVLLASALAALAPDGDAARRALWVFDLGTVLIALALAVLVLLVVVLAGPRRPWDAAHVALSPVVPLAALVSLDLVVVAVAVGGLLAWSRGRPLVAGAALGVAAAAAWPPVMLLLAVVLVGVRGGRVRPVLVAVASAAGAWAVVAGAAAALDPAGWSAHWGSVVASAAGYGSPWLLPLLLPGVDGLSPSAVTALWGLGQVAVVLGGAAFALATHRRPRLPQVALVLVAGSLAVGPAFPVQASLWLLPLVALTAARWRDHLAWAGAEAVYVLGVWLYVAGTAAPERGLSDRIYAELLVLRLVAVAWLVVQTVRAARVPGRDPVRAGAPGVSGRDDPAGGPVEDAADALVVRVRG